MDYTQNPFLKDDNVYYSEVADIRDDVNALATEISQINITLTDDIRNVDERLNAYQNSIKQNVFTNILNTNVANINTAYINDINAKNVKTNVLDVNVLNVASINNTVLANPHIENMDAVNGQILNAEIKDSVIVNGNGSFNSLNTNTINIESGSIKRANIADSTLTNVVINGFDLNNPVHLNVNYADFNVANFNNIYGINANFYYIERVNTDNVRTTNIVVNGDARFHIINADYANIKNIDNTSISNVILSNVKIKGDLVLPAKQIVNAIDANYIEVEDINAKAIAVQELTDVNLIHANNVSSDWGYIQNLGVHNLTLDVSKEPKETPYVLGYDVNGNIFPAIAQGGGGGGSVVLPENADYIYTDTQGLPLKGTAATDLNDSNALVKASLVAPLVNKINELEESLAILDELKPNQTVDYFNSISPLDYRSITSFETGKTTIKDKNNYTVVADGVLGFTGLKVDNNVLHFDSTLNNFYYNQDLSYMFNGCSNFDGTGFNAIPDGTTNTAFMFADTKLKKPYVLPASVVNSDNMYKNVLFETTPGENIDGLSGLTFKVNDSFDTNVINSNINLYSESRYVNDANLSVINSYIGFNNVNNLAGLMFNNSNLYFENVYVTTDFDANNSNVTIKGDFDETYTVRTIYLNKCEINAVDINGWPSHLNITKGNVYIGNNTNVYGMGAQFNDDGLSNVVHPKVIYPYTRTNWAGLYKHSYSINTAFLNEILPTATDVDEMFAYCYGNGENTLNNYNVYSVLNKDISSLYGFKTGLNADYSSLADFKAVFPNVKNIGGDSNVVAPFSQITEDDVAGFTDISGISAKIPAGVATFNVPTLTTLSYTFSGDVNNVNIVISNNCIAAPSIYNRVHNRKLTGDLSGIKNGSWLYAQADQWFGYPENLETAQNMYNGALFNEIGAPIPSRLTNTTRMFNSCKNLTSIPEGFLDLSNCMDASFMFNGCENLTSVDFNFLKTLKPGSSIEYMFAHCNNLVLTDSNVFSWIPEGVSSYGWFGGMLVSDVNTNNESIISTLSGLNVDGNVDISFSLPSFTINVINNKSLNVSINTETLPNSSLAYRLNASKYNLSINGGASQVINVSNLGSGVNDSYFEVSNCKNIQFDGGVSSSVENSRFIFRNIDNACINNYNLNMYNTTIELNNINFFNLSVMVNNVHLNQISAHGFDIRNVIVDSAANIDTIDRPSTLSNVSFIDNRLNINTLANEMAIFSTFNVTDIYLNSIKTNGKFLLFTNNIIVHIPTNADLATGLNNGTYGSFPNENIIQY